MYGVSLLVYSYWVLSGIDQEISSHVPRGDSARPPRPLGFVFNLEPPPSCDPPSAYLSTSCHTLSGVDHHLVED